MAGSVAAFVRFEGESSSDWRPPASWQHVSPAQSSLELDSLRIAKIFEKDVLQRPTPARVPSTLSKAPLSSAPANNGGEVNATPNELEMSRPPSPTALEMSELKQSWKRPQMNRWRVLTACLINFAGGCSDSAPGALLPYIEQYYHVNYAIVSMIFITNAVGFIAASGIVQLLDSKLGRAKTLMLSEIIVAIGYVMMIIPPPYAVFALGYFFTGLGMATTLALNNVFCANLSNATVILGFLHGSYGLGGVLSPIIATTMVTHGILFSRFYSALLGLRVINFCMVTYSFRHFERDLGLDNNARLIQRTASGRQIPTSKTVRFNEYFKALKNRTTLIGALFIFAYQGAEVSISGWVISFLITVRQGDPAHVGYVTAGFWGGITLGRFVLSPLGHKYGEKLLVFTVIALTVIFQIVVWQVPNVIGDAISVALIGLLLGPIYPCATTIFSRLLPHSLQNTAIAFISSAGSSGGALAPFATGLIAKSSGTWVLHPICVALYVVMMGCWSGLPRMIKRSE